MRGRAPRLVTACGVAGLVLGASGCGSGPQLSTDWHGVETAVLTADRGHTYFVGIDPAARAARALVRVPETESDDDVAVPQVVQVDSKRWWIAVPQRSGGARLYGLDRGGRRATDLGLLPGDGTLFATDLGAVLVGAADPSSTGGTVWRLGADGRVAASSPLPWSPTLAAGGGLGVCAAHVDQSATAFVRLPTQGASATPERLGSAAVALVCDGARPVVVVAGAPSTATAEQASTRQVGGVDLVTVGSGTVVGAAADGDGVAVAVRDGEGTSLVDVRRSGASSSVPVDGVADAAVLRPLGGGRWLVLGHDTAAVVGDSRPSPFELPGALVSTS